MGEVVILDTITSLPIPVERVLDGAKVCPEDVVVAGWDENGDFYLASSMTDMSEVLVLLALAQKNLLERY